MDNWEMITAMAPVRLGDEERPGLPVRRVQASWAKDTVG